MKSVFTADYYSSGRTEVQISEIGHYSPPSLALVMRPEQ